MRQINPPDPVAGLLTSYTSDGVIHILLVVALAVVVIQRLHGRRLLM